MFKAKKLTENSFALFTDGREFARLQNLPDRWVFSTTDSLLKTIFDATEFAADATVTDVLRAVRAMIDHIDALTDQARQFIAGGFTVRDLALISCVIERGLPLAPVAIKLDEQPEVRDEPDGGIKIENPVPSPKLPPLDALDIPFAVSA